MANPIDLSDLSKFQIRRKDDAKAALSDSHVAGLQALIKAQGDIASLEARHRTALADLQAAYAHDPNIVGHAAVADFSLRVVSIHKTWGFFKSMRTAPGFDPANITRTNLKLDTIIKKDR